jgi:hypothetical protein
MVEIDSHRANAYRHLLDMAMLDIRMLCQSRGRMGWWPNEWRLAYRRSRRAGALADWLHNLASFAAREFRGFDDARFWQSMPTGSPFDAYERHFAEALTGQPGEWGGGR